MHQQPDPVGAGYEKNEEAEEGSSPVKDLLRLVVSIFIGCEHYIVIIHYSSWTR